MKRFFVILAMVLLTGCTTTEKSATVGGLGGATLGGIIGHQSNHDIAGAAIGGVAGTVGGLIVGEHLDKKFCPQCGRTYPADTRFCPLDGTELKLKQ
jgi:uncharacterized protein YcfJ